jgi:hypothetical protein
MDERKFCIGDRVRLESPWVLMIPMRVKRELLLGIQKIPIVFKCSSAMGTHGASQNFA